MPATRLAAVAVTGSLIAALACGGGAEEGGAAGEDGGATEAAGNGGAGAAAPSCVADYAESPCDLLTESLVRAAIPEAPAGMEQDGYTGSSFSNCSWSWPSDRQETREVAGRSITYDVDNSIRLSWIQPLESDDPRDEFRRKYLPTQEEVRRGLESMEESLDERVEEGEMTEGEREIAGGLAESVGGGMSFEPVEGAGDMASWSGGTLYVLDGSTSFQIESDVSAEAGDDRAAAVEVANAVIAACE